MTEETCGAVWPGHEDDPCMLPKDHRRALHRSTVTWGRWTDAQAEKRRLEIAAKILGS